MPGRQSFQMEMVEDRQDLGNAIAINLSMPNLGRLIGPARSGRVIAWTAECYCFLVDYFVVIASLVMMW
jgi:hypothetical protein